MDFLQDLNVCLVSGTPKLDLVQQRRLYECSIGENNFFTQPTALLSRLINATQCAVDLHCLKDTILTNFQHIEDFVFTNTILLLIYFYILRYVNNNFFSPVKKKILFWTEELKSRCIDFYLLQKRRFRSKLPYISCLSSSFSIIYELIHKIVFLYFKWCNAMFKN